MNFSPHAQLALIVIAAVAAFFGPSGIIVWLRIRGQHGIDRSQKKHIDQEVANLGDERIAAAQQEFDRRLNEQRADHEEDRVLAAKRYNRMLKDERFIDVVFGYFRDIAATIDRIIELVPGGHTTVREKGIVIPEPPEPPQYDE